MSNPELVGMQSDSLREAFGKSITELGLKDPTIVVMDADVAGGTGVHHFRTSCPDQFIQCGIAEQNMVSMAAGLEITGLKPFVTTFATFMLRALEQIRLSIAYSEKNVKLVASHPGLDVGPDGASAQCLEDIACMRSLPNMVVLAPCDVFEMSAATAALVKHVGPAYMRTGRSACQNVFDAVPSFEIGKGYQLAEGRDMTIVSCGVMTFRALQAAKHWQKKGLDVRVIHMPTIKPIDAGILHRAAEETQAILTLEDHSIVGGLGSAVLEALSESGGAPVICHGTKDRIGRSGESDELASFYDLGTEGVINIIGQIKERLEVKKDG